MGLFPSASKKIWVASSRLTEDKKIVEKMVKFGAEGVVLKSALHLGSPCKRNCSLCQSPSVYLRKKRLFVDSEAKGFTFYTFHENQCRVKEVFALGADSVQLCSGIELNGPEFIKEAQSVFE